MKLWLVLLLCVFVTQYVFGQTTTAKYNALVEKADALFRQGMYKKAAHTYSAAFKANGWKGSQFARYNAARAWSMAGVPDSAFFSLDRLVSRLFYAADDTLENDKYLKPLQNDKRWQPFLARIRKNKLPTGWGRAGSKPYSYEMFVDSSAAKDGKNAASIKSIPDEEPTEGFGTLMQTIKADKFLGKRIRMSGYIKSKNVTEWSGFWLRVDNVDYTKALAFDNMRDGKTDRAVRGTSNWSKYDIVVDVPEEAASISFGALLFGPGQIWFDNLEFEIVDRDVPTTGHDDSEPVNLNFEKQKR